MRVFRKWGVFVGPTNLVESSRLVTGAFTRGYQQLNTLRPTPIDTKRQCPRLFLCKVGITAVVYVYP